jgi:prepilin-type N-terminal cleavage/methylation domain-containing protein
MMRMHSLAHHTHTPPRSTHTRPGGFSLVELIVSITIFLILSTLLIANFYRGRQADDLRLSAQEFAGYLRRVQNLSTAGQSIFTPTGERVPPGGYGISIPWVGNANTYVLFADIRSAEAGPCTDTNPVTANSQYEIGCDIFADAATVTLRPSVVIYRMKVKTPTGETLYTFGSGGWDALNNRVDIAFRPPKPIPVLDGETGRSIQIEFQHLKTSQTRTVTIIGASGQISERIGSIL